ncbi:MAG: glycoside hydrolase family 108 protein [Phenylobacterium sp.]
MTRFTDCLPRVLQDEGGFVEDPQDPGGATNLGVTLATLSHWLGHPATIDDVKALTPATVAPIYEASYWRAAACDQLPMGVDYMVFDMAVNSGPGRAVKFLQQAVGVPDDGAIGPRTLAAVAGLEGADILQKISGLREAFYRGLSTFPRFGRGWLARLRRVTDLALADAVA